MNSVSRTFPAQLPVFEQIRTMIEEFAATAQFSSVDRHKLTLIVEELFTNTVIHGYKGDCDEPVSISLEGTGAYVSLTYEDAAPPFNPLAAGHDTDIDAQIWARRVGGLGAFLTTQLTHRALYSFSNGRNRIELILSSLPA